MRARKWKCCNGGVDSKSWPIRGDGRILNRYAAGLFCIPVFAVILVGCGSSSRFQLPDAPPPRKPPPVAQQQGSVIVTPAYAALLPGQTLNFTAHVKGGGAMGWSVNNIAGGNSTVG